MIYIRIELWPGGDRKRAKLLHEGVVWNRGGTAARGEYGYKLSVTGGFEASEDVMRTCTMGRRVLRAGDVRDFPRKRLSAWDLLLRALKAAVGDRNPCA